MSLTRRGWLLLAGSAALFVSGRLLGVVELIVLGAAAALLVLGAAWQVRATPLRLEATRELHPARVHAGSDSRVELAIANRGRRRTPVLAVRDPFDGGRRQAGFLLAPLAPGEVARAAYRLPTQRRGVFDLGPLEVVRTDAFGVASAAVTVASRTQLTVYPRIEPIAPLPHTIGHDPYAGADHPNALGSMGDDFYALRPYETGDDLRRVHWASTARLDDLMIRQDEMPWQGRVTVLLDARRRAHTPESFELAVSAAASIVAANWGRRSLVRLVTSDGLDTGWAAGASHTDAVMELLATVAASRHDRLTEVLGALRQAGNGGALAVVTAGATEDDQAAIARLRTRFGSVTTVVFDPSSWDPALPPRGADTPGLVRVTGAAPFATAWDRAVARQRAGVRA